LNELVIMHNKQAVTSSNRVADVFGKEHRNVLATIGGLLKNQQTQHMFMKSTYVNEQNGQSYPMYYMNRDGFTLLAMGFTGNKALQFKISYINAFNSMETQIKTGYVIPGSYAEALKLAASQAEQIEDMKPKALFADAVATSHTSILIGDLAKLIRQNGVDIGQNRLIVCKSALARITHFKYITKSPLLANAGGGFFCAQYGQQKKVSEYIFEIIVDTWER